MSEADTVQAGVPKPPPGLFLDAWHPRFARYLLHAARSGGRSVAGVPRVETFGDGVVLDVSGQPRVLHTPSHMPGHCALLLDQDGGVLFSGDALVTLDTATGRRGPRLIRWNDDGEQATAAYERLRAHDAPLVLPGHGEPWRR